MANVISILSKKGGVGKTPLAVSLAIDLGMYLISNDDSVIEDIFPDSEAVMIQKSPALIDDCVYDFGGFVSDSVLHIVESSDIILIPCDKKIDTMKRTLKTVQEINKYNKNIFIVATDYKTDEELRVIKEDLKEFVPNLPVLELKHTGLYHKVVEYGASLNQLVDDSPLLKKNCSVVLGQYNKILNTAKEKTNAN